MDKKHFEKITFNTVGSVMYVEASGQDGFGKYSICISNNVLFVYKRGKLMIAASSFILKIFD